MGIDNVFRKPIEAGLIPGVVAMMQILPIGDPHVLETMIAFEQALYATRSLAENGEQRAS